MTDSTERPVLLTTAHRGVFFGYADDTSGSTIHLRRARCALYWSPNVRGGGFLGLAATGPAADIALRDVTSVTEVTPAYAQIGVPVWAGAGSGSGYGSGSGRRP